MNLRDLKDQLTEIEMIFGDAIEIATEVPDEDGDPAHKITTVAVVKSELCCAVQRVVIL